MGVDEASDEVHNRHRLCCKINYWGCIDNHISRIRVRAEIRCGKTSHILVVDSQRSLLVSDDHPPEPLFPTYKSTRHVTSNTQLEDIYEGSTYTSNLRPQHDELRFQFHTKSDPARHHHTQRKTYRKAMVGNCYTRQQI